MSPGQTPAEAHAELCRYLLRKPEAWESVVGFLAPGCPRLRAHIRVQKLRGRDRAPKERKENSFLVSSTTQPVDTEFLLRCGAPPSGNAEPTPNKSSSGARPRCPVSSPLLSCSCLAGWAPGQMLPKGRMPAPHGAAAELAPTPGHQGSQALPPEALASGPQRVLGSGSIPALTDTSRSDDSGHMKVCSHHSTEPRMAVGRAGSPHADPQPCAQNSLSSNTVEGV